MSLKYTVQWTAEGVDLSELILWKLEFVELQFDFGNWSLLFNMQTVKLVYKKGNYFNDLPGVISCPVIV